MATEVVGAYVVGLELGIRGQYDVRELAVVLQPGMLGYDALDLGTPAAP